MCMLCSDAVLGVSISLIRGSHFYCMLGLETLLPKARTPGRGFGGPFSTGPGVSESWNFAITGSDNRPQAIAQLSE